MCGGLLDEVLGDFDALLADFGISLGGPSGLGGQAGPPPIIPPSHFDNGKPTLPVTHYDHLPRNYPTNPAQVTLENFSSISYEQALNDMAGAEPDVAHGIPDGLAQVSQGIATATEKFLDRIQALHLHPDGHKGHTADAAFNNIISSLHIPHDISTGASALSVLAQAFSNTISTTSNDIVSNSSNYTENLINHPDQRDQIINQYNSFAQAVMKQSYEPNIQYIAAKNPTFITHDNGLVQIPV